MDTPKDTFLAGMEAALAALDALFDQVAVTATAHERQFRGEHYDPDAHTRAVAELDGVSKAIGVVARLIRDHRDGAA